MGVINNHMAALLIQEIKNFCPNFIRLCKQVLLLKKQALLGMENHKRLPQEVWIQAVAPLLLDMDKVTRPVLQSDVDLNYSPSVSAAAPVGA